MTRSKILLCVLVVVLVGAAGTVSGADGYDVQCEGFEETTVIGVTPTGELLNGDTDPLYPGSVFSVVVCENGSALDRDGGERWGIDERGEAYEIEDRTQNAVKVRVTAAERGVNLGQYVDIEHDSEFRIESPGALLYDGRDGPLGTQLRLYDSETSNSLKDHIEAFRNATAKIERLSGELDELSISEEHDPAVAAEYAEKLRNISAAQQTLREETTAIEILLYEQAMNHPRPENITMAMSTLYNERTAATEQPEGTVDESLNRLEIVESKIQSDVRGNVGLGMAGGLVVGIAAGIVGPWRKGKEVDDFYQVSSKNKFTADVLTLPWVVGGVLLVGGLAAMVLLDIFGVIV